MSNETTEARKTFLRQYENESLRGMTVYYTIKMCNSFNIKSLLLTLSTIH